MREFANLQTGTWGLGLAGRAGVALVFAAVLAFLAPFGTYRFDAFERVGYWTLLMGAWLILSLATSWLVEHMRVSRSRTAATRRAAATLLASLPMIVVTGVANNMMTGWQPSPDEIVELFVSIILIGGLLTFLSDRLVVSLTATPFVPHDVGAAADARAEPPLEDRPATERVPGDTTLLDRLPAHIRNDILCLQVEDHYVRVHSGQSSAMVLMRFSDALRGLGHVPGSQVHRSWWVATDAVVTLRRTGRTAQLTLSNGALVPVSQPYLAQAMSIWGERAMSVA